ncbi:hypothetical protein NA57DRAFT_72575 [Rhizodiscina lignyota]|uniref:Xylanolytic transcriptional activator regulatory domain-containing protein n=1 Tax=Rhizodiscina lignyota TaxID=1504668 RepID=A0A9P4IL89_9PEZI|nr:hypothetical protein NA57DRAFT_72575 [Rhizodiscina lignyota]
MTRAPTAVRQWHVSTVDGGPPRSSRPSTSDTSPVTPTTATSNNAVRPDAAGLRTPQSVPGPGGLTPGIEPPKSSGELLSGPAAQQDSFLGSTSYSAALAESHRGSVVTPDPMFDRPDTLTFTRFVTPATKKAEQDRINYGARLLALLPTLPLAEELIDRYMRLSQVVIVPSMVVNLSLQALRRQMDSFSTDEKCYEMSRRIFIETNKPIHYNEDLRPNNYHEFFTGEHLRWEILGLIFTLMGLSCMTIGEETSFASTIVSCKVDWKILMEEMLLASNQCISFAYHCQTLNDMFVWLLHCNLTFLTMHRGESNHIVWRRLGDLSTAVYEMGLHQDPGSTDTAPFFLKELRKRCFGTAYCADKAIATFLGRPPLISRQYSCSTLPVDLDTSAIMSSSPGELANHLAELDSDGWNVAKGHFVRATFLRVRMAISYIREDVLLLSLGTEISDLEARVYSTLQKAETAWNNFPQSARYSEACWTSETDPIICFMMLLLYLDHLHSLFLLYRLLVRKRDTGAEMLVDTARKLLSAVLVLCKERSRLIAIATDFPWIILYYGLPSAALLSAELYRQQAQQPPPSSQSFLSTANTVPLPRSELIRNLSVFVSAMEWASSPSDGNYSLCVRARRHLSRVLDEILEQPASMSPPPAAAPGLNTTLANGGEQDGTDDALNEQAAAGTLAAMAGVSKMDGMPPPSSQGLGSMPGQDDDWQNMEFFLDGLVDNNIDMMDWNLGL